MPIIPAGFGQCTFAFLIEGDTEEMLTSIGLDLAAAGGDFQEVVEGAHNVWGASVLLEQSVACTLVRTILQVGQDGGDPLVFEAVIPQVGTDGDGPLPPNVAFLVRKSTSLGGRAGRGRMFVPGVALQSSYEANGTVEAAKLADLQLRFSAFRSNMISGNAGDFPASPPVLLHSTAIPPPTDILALQAQGRLATQRRRLRP